jgi:2-polyprenyl-3-methyl-5-hydroxy-6-metoxy-1,4-benzoquinol methylase
MAAPPGKNEKNPVSHPDFWSDRLKRYGHTGWADAATYAYDQRLRLQAVREVLREHHGQDALDFGCGVGDFCALLAEQLDTVVGYDASPQVIAHAQQTHSSPKVLYTADLDTVWARHYNVILSITVLQHVVNDDELAALLQRFAATLNPGGRVVVLETLGPSDAPSNAPVSYLKRRSLAQLLALFQSAGLQLIAQRGFYHPTECPTPQFLAYRQRFTVRLLARLAAWRVAGATTWLQRLAQRAASADTTYLNQPQSPTQLLVFGHNA